MPYKFVVAVLLISAALNGYLVLVLTEKNRQITYYRSLAGFWTRQVNRMMQRFFPLPAEQKTNYHESQGAEKKGV